MDDQPVDERPFDDRPRDEGARPDELVGPDQAPTAEAPPARVEAPPAGFPAARTAALLGLGILIGLGVGWVAFRNGDSGGSAPAASAPATSGAAETHGIDVSNDPVLGIQEAPVTIVEFSDFDCPFCTRFATETAPVLRRHYGDRVRWIFVNLPLRSIHPRAYEAALAGECANEEGRFWEWYDAMFSGLFDSSPSGLQAAAQSIGLDPGRFEQCLENADYATEVAADLQEAEKYYILGTPTFFINGVRLEGAQPPEAFAAVIDSILSRS